MEDRAVKIPSISDKNICLKIIPGHFTTNHSHINYYIDMTTTKTRHSEARNIARAMKQKYETSTIVDTIICMDGCEVIGAYLADELTKAGYISKNAHQTIYIVKPEFNSNGQMIFRDNVQPAINGKNCILLVASATTGKTISRCVECIQYYGGTIAGISAIFSAIDKVDNILVDTIFKDKDIPGYATYNQSECPYCKKKVKIDAIVNGYGYTKL